MSMKQESMFQNFTEANNLGLFKHWEINVSRKKGKTSLKINASDVQAFGNYCLRKQCRNFTEEKCFDPARIGKITVLRKEEY